MAQRLYQKNPVRHWAVQFDGENFLEVQKFCGFHKATVQVQNDEPETEENSEWWEPFVDEVHDVNTFGRVGTYLRDNTDPDATAELWVQASKMWLPIAPGEWILKDDLGFYPCADVVFQMNYSAVND